MALRQRHSTVTRYHENPLRHPSLYRDGRRRSSAATPAERSAALRERRNTAYSHVQGDAEEQDSGRLSCCTYMTYAAPTMGAIPVVMLISVYATTFYEKIGANLSYIALFIALARSFDVISDPLMSFITDSYRSKHGRRRPFMLTGCIPYGIFLVMLLVPPPSFGGVATSVWFGMTYILFFLMNTYTNIPYDALGPELTDNYDDRSRLFFWRSIFDGFGTLVAVMAPVGLSTMLAGPCDFGSCDLPVAAADRNASAPPGAAPELSIETCTANPVGGAFLGYSLAKMPGAAAGVPLNLTQDSCAAGCGSVRPELEGYCACRDACTTACALDNERMAYMLVAVAFSVWFAATMAFLVFYIKERDSEKAGKTKPLVPLMLNIMQNRLFKSLLPAWVCDAIVNAVIGSMLTYFVRYVVVPEYQPGCCGGSGDSWTCDSTMVLAASAVSVLLAAFAGSPLWLFAAAKLGKRRAWLLWSLTMAGTNALYMLVGEGDVYPCIVVSAINGLPMGAKFLSDTILADIIDYDEWLRGSRNEATYMMFKSFLPKIAAIPASAVPVALLNAFGHVAPVGGRIMRQQGSAVAWYVRVVIVIIPTALSILAFALKTSFPLKTKEQTHEIAVGIGQHMLGLPAVDPISGVVYSLLRIDDNGDDGDWGEQATADLLDNFPGVKPISLLLDSPLHGAMRIRHNMFVQFAVSLVFIVGGLVGMASTISLLSNDDLSFVPVLMIVLLGACLTVAIFGYLRLKAARQLVARVQQALEGGAAAADALPRGLLERMLDNRRIIWDSSKQLAPGLGGTSGIGVKTAAKYSRQRAISVWHHIQTYEPSEGAHCSCLRISFHTVNLTIFLVGLIFCLRGFESLLPDGKWPDYLGVELNTTLVMGAGGVLGIVVVLSAALVVHLMGHTDEQLRRRCIKQLGAVFYVLAVFVTCAVQLQGCLSSASATEHNSELYSSGLRDPSEKSLRAQLFVNCTYDFCCLRLNNFEDYAADGSVGAAVGGSAGSTGSTGSSSSSSSSSSSGGGISSSLFTLPNGELADCPAHVNTVSFDHTVCSSLGSQVLGYDTCRRGPAGLLEFQPKFWAYFYGRNGGAGGTLSVMVIIQENESSDDTIEMIL
eukprot:g5055.t1